MATKEIFHPIWRLSIGTSDNKTNKDIMKAILGGMLSVNPELLTQASTTGQLTEASIDALPNPLPTTPNGYEYGYFLFRYFDGMREIFIRISFRVVTASWLGIYVNFGTAVSSAGAITTRITSSETCITSQYSIENTTNTTTLISCSDGFFGLTFRSFEGLTSPQYNNHIHFSYPENSAGEYDRNKLIVGSFGGVTSNWTWRHVNLSSPGADLVNRQGTGTHSPPLGFAKNSLTTANGIAVAYKYFGFPEIMKHPNVCYVKWNQARENFQFDEKVWIKQNVAVVQSPDGLWTCMAMRWE